MSALLSNLIIEFNLQTTNCPPTSSSYILVQSPHIVLGPASYSQNGLAKVGTRLSNVLIMSLYNRDDIPARKSLIKPVQALGLL